ncbi:MAG: hypothetical protein QXV17_05300 [Candidatus Micrarchaeaceae archaeon]
MLRKRRAVSEMLAAIILIIIVVSGFSILVYPTLQRFIQVSRQQGSNSQNQATNAGIQITLVYAYATQSGSTTTVTLYLDSYGVSPFTPSSLIVALGSNTYTVNYFTITYNGALETTIQPGQNVVLQFSIPYSGAMPSTYEITAIGSGATETWDA